VRLNIYCGGGASSIGTCTHDAFAATWEVNYEAVYDGRRAEVRAAMPGDAHQLIAEWQQRCESMI
jgi:NAD-dependent SIR2 family protein deacetylase